MSLEQLYGHLWTALGEGELEAADEASPPRGPELLFEITDAVAPCEGSLIVDLGCGPGDHAARLVERYGARAIGIDPLASHLIETRGQKGRVFAVGGRMEAIPLPASSVDLLWLRDALLHSRAPEQTLEECHRVLRGGGHLLLHAAFATDELSSRELEILVSDLQVVAGSLDFDRVAAAIERCGFRIARAELVGSELAEHYELADGLGSRALMRLARLKREPERMRERLGEERYRAAFGVYHWVVFELLGKVSYRTLLLHKEP